MCLPHANEIYSDNWAVHAECNWAHCEMLLLCVLESKKMFSFIWFCFFIFYNISKNMWDNHSMACIRNIVRENKKS